MDFNTYQIPKEYTDKFKVTKKDENTNLSIDDIEIIHNVIMDLFWEAKGMNKERYTPNKFKKNIYVRS